MPTVTLTFTTLPEHVRTARLVAAAVARRHGLTEDVLDDIRLAVGEACARAVARAQDAGRQGTMHVEIFEPPDRLVVVIRDDGDAGSRAPDATAGDIAEQVSLTIVRALADEVQMGTAAGARAGTDETTDETTDDMDGVHAASAGALRLVWHL
ncbi:MAG TPA: ATP-binding protein [Actinomycetales bacterium]|nr:ATP-binding protein [Actinomycetales bacterium]